MHQKKARERYQHLSKKEKNKQKNRAGNDVKIFLTKNKEYLSMEKISTKYKYLKPLHKIMTG